MRSSSEGGGKKGEGDMSMFQVPKTLSVNAASGWEGDDVRLAVTFEPTEIGTVRDVLTVSSPAGGEYVCDLIATCIPPLPQGPFNFTKGGGPVEIPFRNCFATSCNWSYSVDSPAFKVSASTGTVAAKTEGKCSVVFDPQGTVMARNTILSHPCYLLLSLQYLPFLLLTLSLLNTCSEMLLSYAQARH